MSLWSKYPRSFVVVCFLCAILVFAQTGFSACTVQYPEGETLPAPQNSEHELTIVASIFAPYDFARVITGGEAQVSMLVPPGAETHSFEPTPSDLILLSTCDVFIYVGGESDAWIEKILASLDNPNLVLVRLVDLVETVEEEVPLGEEVDEGHEYEHSHEHEHEHEGEEIDEHVWTSLRNAQVIVSSLAQTFASLDTLHAELFSQNAAAYNKELAKLDEQISETVSSAQRSTVVFGDRFPFRYFADDYDLTCYAAFSGCSTAVDTNPATLVFLINTVRDEQLPSVFFIELSDERIARTISDETEAQKLLFHSAHTISQDDFAAGASYLSIMQNNAENLRIALN